VLEGKITKIRGLFHLSTLPSIHFYLPKKPSYDVVKDMNRLIQWEIAKLFFLVEELGHWIQEKQLKKCFKG
jgi:hypothetical protein